MKKILAAVVAVIMVMLMFIVVIISDEDEDVACTPNGGSTSSSESGESIAANAEGLAEPLGPGTLDKVTSTYKSPDRPGHRGIDIAKEDGHPIYSMADGTVVKSEPAGGFGMWVVIAHNIDGQQWETVYGHMFAEGIHVKAGDQVKAGDHIADQGWNGGVDPAGPGGSHLHIEWWKGSRDTGTESDPMPWLEKAAEGAGDGGPSKDSDKESDDDKGDSKDDGKDEEDSSSDRSGSGKEMPDSDKIQNQDKLQVDSVRVARAVAERFPEVETIGGWRPSDPYPDHPSGRAVDVMIPDWQTNDGKKLGDEIRDYIHGNRDHFNIEYMIWRQTYIPAEGEPNQMEDRGDPTQNHFDHVHVTTVGGGMPKADQKYGPSPDGGGQAPGEASDDGCAPESAAHVDGSLSEGEVPKEFVKWLKLGGGLCKGISAPLLAAQIQQESGFQKEIGSPAGAYGPSQFMPGTWQTWGYKVDENGENVGEAGGGDITDPADATMAQARMMCASYESAENKRKSGAWKGDPVELALAAYNAGEGNVDTYGGVPPFAETQHYVKIIPESAKRFEEKV